MKTKWCDPPEGWKYGFPKPYKLGSLSYRDWLLKEGYPERLIDLACKYSRFWEEENSEEEIT